MNILHGKYTLTLEIIPQYEGLMRLTAYSQCAVQAKTAHHIICVDINNVCMRVPSILCITYLRVDCDCVCTFY